MPNADFLAHMIMVIMALYFIHVYSFLRKDATYAIDFLRVAIVILVYVFFKEFW